MSQNFFQKIDLNLSKEWLSNVKYNIIENNSIHPKTSKIIEMRYFNINEGYLKKSELLYEISKKYSEYILLYEIPPMYFLSWHLDYTRKSIIMFPIDDNQLLRRTLFTNHSDPNKTIFIGDGDNPSQYNPSFRFSSVSYEFGKAHIINSNKFYHCGINLYDTSIKMGVLNCKHYYDEMCEILSDYCVNDE